MSEEVINLGNNTSETISAMVESITLLSEAVTAIIYMKYSKQFVNNIVDKKDLLSILVGGIFIFIICGVIAYMKMNTYLSIVLSILFSGIVYFTIQVALRNKIVVDFLQSFKR